MNYLIVLGCEGDGPKVGNGPGYRVLYDMTMDELDAVLDIIDMLKRQIKEGKREAKKTGP